MIPMLDMYDVSKLQMRKTITRIKLQGYLLSEDESHYMHMYTCMYM